LINTDTVTSSGAQTYTGAATLGTDTTLQGASIGFGSTLDSAGATPRNLTLTASGDVSAAGTVGALHPLGTVTVTSAHNLTFQARGAATSDFTQTAGNGTTTFNGGSIGGGLGITTDAITLTGATLATTGPVSLTAQNAVTLGAGLNAGASTV